LEGKIKIRITFKADDGDRRVIARQVGKPGKADYETVRSFIQDSVEGVLETAGFDFDEDDDDT